MENGVSSLFIWYKTLSWEWKCCCWYIIPNMCCCFFLEGIKINSKFFNTSWSTTLLVFCKATKYAIFNRWGPACDIRMYYLRKNKTPDSLIPLMIFLSILLLHFSVFLLITKDLSWYLHQVAVTYLLLLLNTVNFLLLSLVMIAPLKLRSSAWWLFFLSLDFPRLFIPTEELRLCQGNSNNSCCGLGLDPATLLLITQEGTANVSTITALYGTPFY